MAEIHFCICQQLWRACSTAFRLKTSLTLCFAHSRQTAAQPMFPTSQKSLTKQPRWTPPCSKSNSKSKKLCANTRTRPFPQNKNKLSYRRTACWYLSRQTDRADRFYFYLPTPQNLSTKSTRTVEKFSRPGAVVLSFWGHFGVKLPKSSLKLVVSTSFCCLSVTKKISCFERGN